MGFKDEDILHLTFKEMLQLSKLFQANVISDPCPELAKKLNEFASLFFLTQNDF